MTRHIGDSMKKFLVTILAATCLLSVSGCAKDEQEEPSGPPATIATPTTPKSVPNEGGGGKDDAGATPTFDKQAAYTDVASAFINLKRLSHTGGCDKTYKDFSSELSHLATDKWIKENVSPWNGVKPCSQKTGSFSFDLVGTPFDAYGVTSNADKVVTEFQYEMRYNSPNDFRSNGMRDRKMNIQVEAVKSGGGYLIDKTGSPDSLKPRKTEEGKDFGYDPETGKWFK